MNKQEMLEYARKYKKSQKIISVVVSIFIMLLGLLFLAVGIFLCFDDTILTKVIGIIIITAGFLDFLLGVRFIKFSYNNLKYMQDRDAAIKYCRIHGIK